MQSCVDEAWFQRPDQQQGPFWGFGGGTSLSLEIFGMILGISQFFFFFRGNGRK